MAEECNRSFSQLEIFKKEKVFWSDFSQRGGEQEMLTLLTESINHSFYAGASAKSAYQHNHSLANSCETFISPLLASQGVAGWMRFRPEVELQPLQIQP